VDFRYHCNTLDNSCVWSLALLETSLKYHWKQGTGGIEDRRCRGMSPTRIYSSICWWQSMGEHVVRSRRAMMSSVRDERMQAGGIRKSGEIRFSNMTSTNPSQYYNAQTTGYNCVFAVYCRIMVASSIRYNIISLQWTLPDPLLGCNIPGYFLT
jgi:hypothetical protein